VTSVVSTAETPGGPGPPTRRRGLVVAGLAVPDWVTRWCARRGRAVRARPLDAVAAASRVGDSVLVPQDHDLTADRPRIVAAVTALPDDAAVLDEAVEAAQHLRGSLVVVHAVPLSFGERTIGLPEALHRGQKLLDLARALAGEDDPGVVVDTVLVRAWPHELVGGRLAADLLVIGGTRTATARAIGLVAATAVRHAPCAVVLAPRPRFPLVGDPAAASTSPH
jgi:nucleotide-binding universal stress UspA family protein